VPEVRCQVSDTEDGPILGGNGEDDLGRHLYCGKCRVNFNGKEELKGRWWRVPSLLFVVSALSRFTLLRLSILIGSRSVFNPSPLPFLKHVWPANLILQLGRQAQTNNHSPVSSLRCLV